jgi:hypothetical protein
VLSKKGYAILKPSLEVLCVTLHEQSNDEAEQSKNSSKNLNGEDLDESKRVSKSPLLRAGGCRNSQCRVRSICQRRATSVDAYTNTADQVAHSHGQSSPEQSISGEHVGGGVYLLDVGELGQLGGEDDGHDDAVDGDDFAKDNGDQVLRSYPGRLDTSAEDGDAGCPDSPMTVSELYATPRRDAIPC